jgi:hypothetical protein
MYQKINNSDLTSKVIECIRNHVPYQIAANANGIGRRTIFYWIERGLEDLENGIESYYSNFAKAIKEIEQKNIAYHVEQICEKVNRWQAHAWILERKWPDHFGMNLQLIEINRRLQTLEETKNGIRNEERSEESNQETGKKGRKKKLEDDKESKKESSKKSSKESS